MGPRTSTVASAITEIGAGSDGDGAVVGAGVALGLGLGLGVTTGWNPPPMKLKTIASTIIPAEHRDAEACGRS